MTHHDQSPVTDPRAELEVVDAQLELLHTRRAWLLDQLPDRAAPVASGAPGASVQRLLLTTGAVLLGAAGLFFAAVAWALVGPFGRLTILLVLGAGLAALASWTRPRLGAAAGAIASVAASLVATAGYVAPELWQVSWSDTRLAAYTAAVSVVLCVGYTVAALVTGIRSWTGAAALAAAVGVVATGTATAAATRDPLGYTVATAALAVAVAAAGAHVRARRAWWSVLTVAAVTSLLSTGAWVFEQERTVAYAVALLGWAVVSVGVQRLVPAMISPVAAWALGAMLAAGAVNLLVGTQPWGAPSLPLAAGGALVAVAAAYARVLPAWPMTAAALVLGAGAVAVPVIHGTASGNDSWVGYLCVVAVAAAAAGWSPRRALGSTGRGLLWWSAGAAAGTAWLVHLADAVAEPPVERSALPVGVLLVLAGAGWMLSVHRSGGGWLPTTATLLPGLLVALLPGSLLSWSLGWDEGLSEELVRTVCYTLVAAVLVALGARLRTAALLIAGEATVAVCVVAHLSAATQAVPQWVALAAAGTLLLAVGARWEWLRGRSTAAAHWVGRLR